jgi:hypothetical protein
MTVLEGYIDLSITPFPQKKAGFFIVDQKILQRKNMCILRSLFFTIILNIACCAQAGCAGGVGMNKAPHEVWTKLAGG